MPLPDALRSFNRVVTNRVLGLLSGMVPPFATVRHTGRRTGRAYRTTVLAFCDGPTVAIALTYGAHVDWARNLLAAGGGEVELADGIWKLVRPRLVVGAEGRSLMPPPVRMALALIRVDQYLLAERHPCGSAAG